MRFSLIFIFLTMGAIIHAQDQRPFTGVYTGTIETGGFEDSLVFNGNTLTVKKDAAWGYGVVHTFVYELTYLADDIVYFKATEHFANGVSEGVSGWFDPLKDQKMKLVKNPGGDLLLYTSTTSTGFQILKYVADRDQQN